MNKVYTKSKNDNGYIIFLFPINKVRAMLDHIHMLLSIPLSQSVSEFMGYLEVKSTLMIFERNAKLKYNCGKEAFEA